MSNNYMDELKQFAEITQKKPHGARYNDGKLKWSYVNFKALEPMVRVLMFGAQKYEPFNWQKGLDKVEVLESLQRHLAAMLDGEQNDVESGLHHIGHLMCNAMFYSYFLNQENGETRELPKQPLDYKETNVESGALSKGLYAKDTKTQERESNS